MRKRAGRYGPWFFDEISLAQGQERTEGPLGPLNPQGAISVSLAPSMMPNTMVGRTANTALALRILPVRPSVSLRETRTPSTARHAGTGRV
jgi:hypothetical protein